VVPKIGSKGWWFWVELVEPLECAVPLVCVGGWILSLH
jgi:hypothetical protein